MASNNNRLTPADGRRRRGQPKKTWRSIGYSKKIKIHTGGLLPFLPLQFTFLLPPSPPFSLPTPLPFP